MQLNLFVGCLNREAPYFQGARGVGLAVFAFDEDTLRVEKRSEIGGVDNPSFLSFDPRGKCVYANSEVFGWAEGVVSAYRFDAVSGDLHYLNKQPTLGSIPAYNTVTTDGRFLLVANYGMGEGGPDQSVAVLGIAADGSLTPAVSSIAHRGSGPVADRQERSHSHCVRQTPDGAFVLVADLGLDEIFTYRLSGDGRLARVAETKMPAGAGPRHLAFHPAGRMMFVFNELDSTICSLRLGADGALVLLDVASAVPEAAGTPTYGADIHVSPDGRFVYGSNRGHDSIAIVAVDQESGWLKSLGQTPSGGQTPRNFTITPSGRHLLVANQNSDNIVIFDRDAANGSLRDTGRRIEIGTPMCVVASEQ